MSSEKMSEWNEEAARQFVARCVWQLLSALGRDFQPKNKGGSCRPGAWSVSCI